MKDLGSGEKASDELEGKDYDKQSETWCVFENKLVTNWLNLNLSLASLSWPLYIGGQVSRNRSSSIQITMRITIRSRISTMTILGPSFHGLLPKRALGVLR
jgi:hypothetical protein